MYDNHTLTLCNVFSLTDTNLNMNDDGTLPGTSTSNIVTGNSANTTLNKSWDHIDEIIEEI